MKAHVIDNGAVDSGPEPADPRPLTVQFVAEDEREQTTLDALRAWTTPFEVADPGFSPEFEGVQFGRFRP